MNYKFFVSNNHELVVIDGRTFLIDTGNPVSFCLDGISQITINGKTMRLQGVTSSNTRENIEQFVGCEVDGFIGLDILKKLETMALDKDNGTAVFGETIEEKDDTIQFVITSYLSTYININGFEYVKTLIDTGAKISYAPSDMIPEQEGKVFDEDYNPLLGHYTVQMEMSDFKIGKKSFQAMIGVMPLKVMLAITFTGCECVLGLEDLYQHRLEMNFTDGYMNLD